MNRRINFIGTSLITLWAMLAMPSMAQQTKPQYGGELVLTGQLDKTMFPVATPTRKAWMFTSTPARPWLSSRQNGKFDRCLLKAGAPPQTGKR